MKFALSLILLLTIFSQVINANVSANIIPVKNESNIIFSFGSCNKFKANPNPEIFYNISEQNPDVWTWVGDIAYLPAKVNMAGVEKGFNDVKSGAYYTHLRGKTTVIGTWDDHDYGENDGDKHYKDKEQVKQLYLDFFDEPKESPRRSRDGVYESYYLGNEKKVKIILLDTRYNKDARFSFKNDMLGENQWKWLEDQLSDNNATFTLIASGSQVFPDDRIFPEHWYRQSRERLFGMIRKHKVSGVIFLSGDVHYAEFMKHPCPKRVGYNLYEFTSSGLTHFVSDNIPFGGQLFNELFTHTFNGPTDRYMGNNFGIIKLDFGGEEPRAIMMAKNSHGTTMLEKEIRYEEVRFKEEIIDMEAECVLDKDRFVRFFGKYLEEIFKGNMFMIKYTLAIGLIGLGVLSTLTLVWIKRGIFVNFVKMLHRKIFRKGENKNVKSE